MREDICSIPINDIFMPKTGCPFCRMRDMLEDRIATYITGAAMMEPDVRIETNRLGFCETHFGHILSRGSRLSVALILESLIAETSKDIFPQGKTPAKKIVEAVKAREDNCFICESVGNNMKHLFASMIRLWESEEEFREIYSQQEYICMNHYGMAIDYAQKMNRKNFPIFAGETTRLAKKQIEVIQNDVTHFCRMFDYRNKGGDWGNSRDSIERTIEYMTSRKPETEQKADEKNR